MNSEHIQFETNGVTVLVVSVTEACTDFYVNQNGLNYYERYGACLSLRTVKLPEGDWSIHAVTPEITEEQAKVLVKSPFQGCYFDYRQDYYYWATAKESFETYLENKGIDHKQKNVLLINRKK